MVDVILLRHPQSPDLKLNCFDGVNLLPIACGTSKFPNSLSEASDFNPNYACLNSCLFESSVILTVWEHLHTCIKSEHVCFLHTDNAVKETGNFWPDLVKLSTKHNVGITVPLSSRIRYKNHVLAENDKFRFKSDPYLIHSFDYGIAVWDIIKRIDSELFEWATDTNPLMIYSHQFMCSKDNFFKLGQKLTKALDKIRLSDTGLWIPHVFERLIALNLAKTASIKLVDYFHHYGSSGSLGQNELKLYGPREYKYFKMRGV